MPLLAERHGFSDHRTIWDHPDNAELKRRRSPTVLLPGDVVVIPERQSRAEVRGTGARHFFELSRTTLRLRVRAFDRLRAPLPSSDRELSVAGRPADTDADGVLDMEIPADTRAAELSIRNGEETIPIHIGDLHPADTPEGLGARLHNLGYDCRADPLLGEEGVDPDQLRFAIELFQHDHGLPVTGSATADLVEAVRAEHGI